MCDCFTPEVRSRTMACIRDKNTRPEMIVRKGLHAMGFRYRLHDKRLPGKPDMVLRQCEAVIEINGCFWHGHTCQFFNWPASNVEYWQKKIGRNVARDAENQEALLKAGWRVLTIWECAFRGREQVPVEAVLEKAAAWLRSGCQREEITGVQHM